MPKQRIHSLTVRNLFPENHQGIIIDLVLILANLFIFPILTSRIGGLFDRSFSDEGPAFIKIGFLMILILAGRLSGLYLKRFPLQLRLEGSEDTSFPAYFLIFNIPVLILTAAFVVTVVSGLFGALGLLEVNYYGQPKDSAVTTFVGLAAMITVITAEIWFIYRLTKPLTDDEKKLSAAGDIRFSIFSEIAADFGLFAYMMVWQIFYSSTVVPTFMEYPNGPAPIEHKIISVIFLAVVFVLFYVGPRVVFLVEDRKHLATWLLIGGVFAASVGRYLI